MRQRSRREQSGYTGRSVERSRSRGVPLSLGPVGLHPGAGAFESGFGAPGTLDLPTGLRGSPALGSNERYEVSQPGRRHWASPLHSIPHGST